MRIRPDEPGAKDESIHGKMLEGASKSYRSFKDYVSIQEDDTIGVVLFKGALHFLGIIFMILLSPFFLIGLTIAFAAVI